jgi:hypothetical protein
MFLPPNSRKKLYLCQSGGWSSVINAEDASEAAAKAMTESLEHFVVQDEPNFTVGTLISCQEIIEDFESATYFLSTAVLADAGFHELAKDLIPANE